MFLNIHSKGKYPSNELSNFAKHPFFFDVPINSMEGFLQSLKTPNNQANICQLVGKDAKEIGKGIRWEKYLYWNGRTYDRFSKEYRDLIEQAYRAMLNNKGFKKALWDSRGKILIHTIGKCRRKSTVLTGWEFCSILMKLRKELTKDDIG